MNRPGDPFSGDQFSGDGHLGDQHLGDRHLGDRLSALLDGELADREAQTVRAHLDGCHTCRTEFEVVATARDWVRGLPGVEPPFGLFERVLIHRRPWRAVAVGMASAAAAIAVLNLPRSGPDSVAPTLPQLVDAHAATASVAGDPVSQLAPVVVPVTFRP